jgi:hypothetical protein
MIVTLFEMFFELKNVVKRDQKTAEVFIFRLCLKMSGKCCIQKF